MKLQQSMTPDALKKVLTDMKLSPELVDKWPPAMTAKSLLRAEENNLWPDVIAELEEEAGVTMTLRDKRMLKEVANSDAAKMRRQEVSDEHGEERHDHTERVSRNTAKPFVRPRGLSAVKPESQWNQLPVSPTRTHPLMTLDVAPSLKVRNARLIQFS